MRSYFHCRTSHYRRRAEVIIVLAGSVCAETAVIAFIVMFFGLFGSEKGGFTVQALTAAGCASSAGLMICTVSALSAKKKIAMHSRYTFADIQLRFAVVSRYCGETKVMGEKTVFRELYYIPFSDFVSAEPSRSGRKIVIRGKIRYYGTESDSLGYHVKNGAIDFDRWWLNHGSFTEMQTAELPASFGAPEQLCDSLNAAKKRFDAIPKPRPHTFREADFIRRRPVKRTFPDDPDFSRRWK